MSELANRSKPVNPHFDHGRVVWDDRYSGQYQAVDYTQQFDDEWRLFLEKRVGFHKHTGVETNNTYIDDRIYELTGVRGYIARSRWGSLYPFFSMLQRYLGFDERRGIGGRLQLEPKFPIDFFRGKRCLDLGCGAGRWTRTLLTLGATVKSVDVSPHALESTRRFNEDVESMDVFDILETRADLHGAFDFTLCWGVIMCTHDPKLAFHNASVTVKPGGHLYAMVYAPTFHSSAWVLEKRAHYHQQLKTFDEKLRYAYQISDRPENAINLLDTLNTFYNWTISEETIHGWYRANGFDDIITLNTDETHKCAYHVLGRRNRTFK